MALYVHWPFCVSKCPYCDFNSHVRTLVDEQSFADALVRDLAHEAAALPGRRLGSIFFGGGTPSLMRPATVERVIEAALTAWACADELEITLEANPTSVEAARFAELAAGGVNRVSLGLQALDEEALRFLGRPHDLAQGLAALELAQRAFGRVSFDLIYARPGQTPEAWRAELDRAISFGTSHMSLYQLTIEPGTRFAGQVARGEFYPLDADAAAELFELTQDVAAGAGLPAYEVSNHARPGAESRHNLAYWRYGDYAGVGPGAHGRRSGAATERWRLPERWLRAVAEAGHGMRVNAALTPPERAREALLMGLRLTCGVEARSFAAHSGVALADAIDRHEAEQLQALGLVEVATDDAGALRSLAVTAAGRLVLNMVIARLAR